VLRLLETAGTAIAGDFPAADSVVRVVGRTRVEGVEVLGPGGRVRRVPCDAVVLIGPLVPDVAIAQQAGCELRSVDGQLCVRVGADGSTTVRGVFASGGVAGFRDEASRAKSGAAAAEGIASFLGVV